MGLLTATTLGQSGHGSNGKKKKKKKRIDYTLPRVPEMEPHHRM